MRLNDIMTSTVHTVTSDTTLVDAAKQMQAGDIGWLPVADAGKVVGVITDRDITIRATAKGLDAGRTKVSEVMTRDVFSCPSGSTVSDVCDLMEKQQVRRIVVKDEQDKLCGIVSLADVALQGRTSQTGDVLKGVSQPS